MALTRNRAWQEPAGWTMAAVGIGCVHLIAADAPATYPMVNAVAAVAGLTAGRWLAGRRGQGAAMILAGLAVLATALVGIRVDGIARWVAVGPVRLQPGLILVPPLVVAFSRRGGMAAALGVAMAVAGLALAPDRGTAGALAAALVVIAAMRRDAVAIALALLASAGFARTLRLADPLAPAPFVEGVLAAAAGHGMRTALLIVGAAAMVAPGLWRLAAGGATRPAAAFVAIWAGLLAAALLGSYPTPVLGYGASGVLGYVLALVALGTGGGRGRRVG
ncbi:hypothetical protein [Sphingomonas sp. 1P08PE]|uniref:hypothetical protein n=1 Tax=Sphingomonas sp. 1P08PE TaxID=554122 RepID=UPI0039A04D24